MVVVCTHPTQADFIFNSELWILGIHIAETGDSILLNKFQFFIWICFFASALNMRPALPSLVMFHGSRILRASRKRQKTLRCLFLFVYLSYSLMGQNSLTFRKKWVRIKKKNNRNGKRKTILFIRTIKNI